MLNYRVQRILTLNNNLAALLFPTSPSAYLRHQLKTPLIRPEVWEVQHAIRIQYSYDAHIIKVKSLSNHLRTHQHVYFIRFKVPDDLLIGIF